MRSSGPWIRKRTGSGKYPAANCWTNGWFNWKTSQTDALVPAPTPGSTSKNDRKSSGFGCRTGVEYEGTKITEIDDDVTIKEIDTTECFVGNEVGARAAHPPSAPRARIPARPRAALPLTFERTSAHQQR